jgi:hypothetical protein
MANPTNPTPKKRRDWKKPFLAALRVSPNVSGAAKRAGVDRAHVYEVREHDLAFAAAWDSAIEEAIDALVGNTWKRARVSDTLAIFLLKSHRPSIYRETQRLEHSGPDSGPIVIAPLDYRAVLAPVAPEGERNT